MATCCMVPSCIRRTQPSNAASMPSIRRRFTLRRARTTFNSFAGRLRSPPGDRVRIDTARPMPEGTIPCVLRFAHRQTHRPRQGSRRGPYPSHEPCLGVMFIVEGIHTTIRACTRRILADLDFRGGQISRYGLSSRDSWQEGSCGMNRPELAQRRLDI